MSDWHELYVNWNLHWPIQELDKETIDKMWTISDSWNNILELQKYISNFIFTIFNPYNYK